MAATSEIVILNVDDDEANRYAKSRVLRKAGFKVIEAGAGGEALRKVATQAPRLVLLDVNLPDLDGFEVCRRIKADPATARTVVLQMSATFRDNKTKVRGLINGADGYLTEPVEPEELIATIKALLRMQEAEESLRAANQMLQAIIQDSPAAIVTLDPRGHVMTWNPAAERLYGWSAQEAIGRRFPAVPPDRWEEFQAGLNATLQGTAPVADLEARRHRKDGRTIDVIIRSAPLRDDKGDVTGIVNIMTDVSERRRTEEERDQLLLREQAARHEAEAANRAKDVFLATLTHELRTPLTALVGWTRLMRSGKLDETMMSQALESVERNADIQARLIESLLDMSRMITGKLSLNVGPLELAPIIMAALDAVRPAAEAKKIQMESRIGRAPALVSGDPDRLYQVVWNLLANAIKFTPAGGRVQIRLEPVQGSHRITVSDTGQGISPEALPHVFDRFYQADGSTSRRHMGVGLGLAAVCHLVELHGGTVQASSPGPDRGAVFTVDLPAIAPQELVPHPEMTDAGPVPVDPFLLAGLRVLVVDAEKDMRECLVVMLEHYGAQVTAVAYAAEALDALERGSPDVLVCDMEARGGDGYALIRQVRARPAEKGGQIPAVALTPYAHTEDRRRALAAGYHANVDKPVEPAELATVLARLTGRQ